jgi:hypothetical protein
MWLRCARTWNCVCARNGTWYDSPRVRKAAISSAYFVTEHKICTLIALCKANSPALSLQSSTFSHFRYINYISIFIHEHPPSPRFSFTSAVIYSWFVTPGTTLPSCKTNLKPQNVAIIASAMPCSNYHISSAV